jgi:hypothetical protein
MARQRYDGKSDTVLWHSRIQKYSVWKQFEHLDG